MKGKTPRGKPETQKTEISQKSDTKSARGLPSKQTTKLQQASSLKKTSRTQSKKNLDGVNGGKTYREKKEMTEVKNENKQNSSSVNKLKTLSKVKLQQTIQKPKTTSNYQSMVPSKSNSNLKKQKEQASLSSRKQNILVNSIKKDLFETDCKSGSKTERINSQIKAESKIAEKKQQSKSSNAKSLRSSIKMTADNDDDDEQNEFMQYQHDEESIILYCSKPRQSKQTPKPIKLQIRYFNILHKHSQSFTSSVYLAIHLPTMFLVRLRIYNKQTLISDNLISEFSNSLKCHLKISKERAPGIAKCFGFFFDETYVYVVQEAVGGQEIGEKKLIKGRAKKLRQKETAEIMKGVTQAIRVLHQNDMIHRFITPKSISIAFSMPKIIDFTYLTSLTSNRKRYSFLGSLHTAPLELLTGMHYDQSIDCWNIGVLLYELATQMKPFGQNNASNAQLMKNIIDGTINYPLQLSNEIVDLLGRIFVKKQERIDIEGILSHEFFSINEDKDMISQQIWSFWMGNRNNK